MYSNKAKLLLSVAFSTVCFVPGVVSSTPMAAGADPSGPYPFGINTVSTL